MGLLGLIKGTGKLIEDAVDGTIDTAVDVVKGDVDKAFDRATKIPGRLGRWAEDVQDDE